MNLKQLTLIIALAVPATALADKAEPPAAQDKAAAKLTDAEIQALAHVQHVNMMEVDMGKAAKAKATAKVKKYGTMLVTDHGKSAKEVAALAKKKGIAKVPEPTMATDAEKKAHDDQMAKMATLKTLKGAEFDKMYLQMMVEGHDKELAKNDTLLAAAADADVKALLDKRKMSLQKHADAARALQKGDAQATR
jgi:putative membrane protein